MNDKPRDPFDLKALELPAAFQVPGKRIFGRKEHELLARFTRFPNTWAWRLRHSRSASTWKLARYLLWLHWWRGETPGQTLKVTGMSQRWGITKSRKAAALAELEALGLIRVQRRDNRNPEVVLRFPPPDGDEPAKL